MESLEVDLGSRSYPILISDGSLSEVGEKLRENTVGGEFVVISDENVDELYGEVLTGSLSGAGLSFDTLVIPPGEESKSLETAGDLYDELSVMDLDRESGVIAFGGGVVGDLAGYVASTFLRGINLVQVPTTLLAQVDSSVGGKTAVNLESGKNLVGTFYQPEMVVIDPSVLRTLSDRDLRSGLGEVLKYGLIWDQELYEAVVNDLVLFKDFHDMKKLEVVLQRCCNIKAEVVKRDEKDRGLRQILNFGHTIGHGLEAGLGYGAMRHGEAVIWGMMGESWISHRRGMLSNGELEEILSSLQRIDLPELPDDIRAEEVLTYVRRDKKNRGGRIQSVLIRSLGGEAVVRSINDEEVIGALDFLSDWR